MQQIMQDRVLQCLRHVLQAGEACDMCADDEGCRVRPLA
jgi:hypothetical protein